MATIFKRIQVKRFDMFKIDDISVARVHSYGSSLAFGQRAEERRRVSSWRTDVLNCIN